MSKSYQSVLFAILILLLARGADSLQGGEPAVDAKMVPLLSVKSVTLEWDKGVNELKVTAEGEASTPGWTNLRLQPVTTEERRNPGVYILEFLGTPPTGISPHHVVPTGSIQFKWKNPPRDLIKVIVRAKLNSLEKPAP